MTESARERQRIVAILEGMKAQAIRDYGLDPHGDSGEGLAVICMLQQCIDKILEATGEKDD